MRRETNPQVRAEVSWTLTRRAQSQAGAKVRRIIACPLNLIPDSRKGAFVVALCHYCGQKVGWLEKAHDSCVRQYQQKAVQAEQARIQRQQKETHERLSRETEERTQREYQAWRLQHPALVDKFFEIAERKVSVLDDYGDENWDALPAEVETLLLKTAKADGHDIASMRALLFRGLNGADLGLALKARIKAKFRPGEVVTDWLLLFTKYSSIKTSLGRILLRSETKLTCARHPIVSQFGPTAPNSVGLGLS
jgi:hypothetical protein